MPVTRLYGPSGAPGAAGLLGLNVAGATAGVLPAKQIVSSGTETVILNPALNSATQALVLSIPPNAQLEQQPFKVVACGYLSTGASSTVTIKLYSGTSTTVGSDTLLGSSGAISAFSGKCPWYLVANLIFDSVSGKMQGSIRFMVNNSLVAETAISNVVTGITNFPTTPGGAPVVNFVLSVTFGTANAANTINVDDFGVYDAVA